MQVKIILFLPDDFCSNMQTVWGICMSNAIYLVVSPQYRLWTGQLGIRSVWQRTDSLKQICYYSHILFTSVFLFQSVSIHFQVHMHILIVNTLTFVLLVCEIPGEDIVSLFSDPIIVYVLLCVYNKINK